MTPKVGTLLMKVQLVVVVGKPEGKTFPLAIAQFKIGRGEGCQLRPNSDQVSREHAMFEVTSDAVYVQDLGSRNGTDVNGKKLAAHDPYTLKNGDLVKVGPLTFAVSIELAAVAASVVSSASPPKKAGVLDDVSHDEIDAWLVSDTSKEPPDRPSGVYGGETLTFESFKAKEKPESSASLSVTKPAAAAPAPAPAPTSTPVPVARVPIPGFKAPTPAPAAKPPAPVVKAPEPVADEDQEVESEIEQYQEDDGIEDLSQTVEASHDMPEDMMDESNPFYKKKADAAPAAAAGKGPQMDSSDAANDILRRMLDRRKASKS